MEKKLGWRFSLIGIVLLVLLAGCSGGNNAPAVNGSGNTPGTTNEIGAATEVSMLIAESLFGYIHEELLAEFETAHPGIKVKLESMPDGGIYDTLRVRISTSEVPDIYQINIGHVTTSMADEAGYIADLTDLEAIQGYSTSLVEASKIDGKVANLSLGVGLLGFQYNKAMLAEVGYSEAPATWDELMDAGEKLKANGKDLLVYAAKWETAISNVFHWTFAQKAVQDPEFKEAYLSNTIDWSNPDYREVLAEGFEKFNQLNQYVRVGSFTNEVAIAQQSFANEESALVLGGTWVAGAIRGLNEDIDLGFMNLPYGPASENPYIFVPEDGVALNAKSENTEAAKTLLNWLFSPEVYSRIQVAKGSMSALNGVGELDPSYVEAGVPEWLNTDRVISFGNTGPVPGPTWVALGQAAQQYTFDNKLEGAIDQFITAYNGSKTE